MINPEKNSLRIYNSLTRKKEEFVPIRKGRIGMYVCGPTVYDEPHIGHARSAYIFDVIRQYLVYKGYDVTFVRNVTDVDDKIIEKARSAFSRQLSAISLEKGVKEVAEKYLDAYHADMKLLGIERPDKEPKATVYIPKMIKFIEMLIKNGRAYESGGDVYFDIKTSKDYGKLSRQDMGKMEAGARISPGENKRGSLDFALWKKAKDDEPSWESPWGRGRPGWHIECSAMSSDVLGDEFDIHGGGIDLIFPHHENEIAQSEGAGKRFARYWIHNGLLTIRGEKMAKSLGNFITIKDFLARYRDADYIKLLFLGTHYRHPVDYTEEKIEEMKREKERFLIFLGKAGRISKIKTTNQNSKIAELENYKKQFEEAMEDDFNTPLALAVLFDLVTYANKLIGSKTEVDKDDMGVLSDARDMLLDLSGIFRLDLSETVHENGLSDKDILKLVAKRADARKSGDFKAADDIRKGLAESGIILEDTKEGTTWRRKI
ncbi:MAG: cysteine--tRNA ligase [Candidatus Omnitrophota bacterium]